MLNLQSQIKKKKGYQCIPGLKGSRACTNILQKMHGYHLWATVRYRSIPPQTVHFWFDRKLKKNYGVTSTLWAFEPSTPRMQRPGSRSATNLVHHRNAIVSLFFALDHTHCHHTAQARLSGNRMQLPKQLNTTKFHTVTTSLRGPFHPGSTHVILS